MTQKRNTGYLVFYHGALVEQCVGAIVCRVKQSELNGVALLAKCRCKGGGKKGKLFNMRLNYKLYVCVKSFIRSMNENINASAQYKLRFVGENTNK